MKPLATYLGLLLCAISTTIALLILGSIAMAHIVDIKFLEDVACQRQQGAGPFPTVSYCFYSEEWDSATYLSVISTFYTTLITVLIALQALISWISFIVIRNSNRQEIESEIEKEIPNFFRTRDADTILRNALNENLASAAEAALKEARDYEDKAVEALQSSVYDDLIPQLAGMKAALEEMDVRVKKVQQDKNNGNAEADAEPADIPNESGRLEE
ncbi:MAG: hypothetical protein ABJD13_02475 [Paracoccaceae bacterium]